MNFDTYELPKEIKKYLKKFGSEKWEPELTSDKKFDLIVVIPTLCEFDNLRLLLKSISECDPEYFDKSLVLFVVNNLKSAEQNIKDDNLKSITFLKKIINENKSDDELVNTLINSDLSFGLVDASSEGNELPEKDGGVGLARKTGMDLALTAFDYNSDKKNILLCTDADSLVEQNYFTEVYEQVNKHKIKSGYVRFAHPVEGDLESQKAIVCYEIFLRYYVLGLIYANSPFAIHTIGSTMLCDAETYCKIQGMNKRKAAEDFYFMEKLCKNNEVFYIKNTGIIPSSRGSWRVPFGTGQRVNRFLTGEMDEYQLYNPGSFEVLKHWFKIFYNEEINSPQFYIDEAEKINPVLTKFLTEQKFKKDWQKILDNNQNPLQINKQKKFWFDGFRTLKLIHFLRDEIYPNINMFNAVDEILENTGNEKPERNEPIPSLEKQIEYLNILRELA